MLVKWEIIVDGDVHVVVTKSWQQFITSEYINLSLGCFISVQFV